MSFDVTEQYFSPITLAGLNAKAEMLTRLDNKYVVSRDVLEKLAPSLSEHFDILDIDGKRSFAYRTQYFDTPTLSNFKHHVQGRRRRSKVRTRHYVDADICFVEVKLKSLRKVTVKKRLKYDVDSLHLLTQTAFQFIEETHLSEYGHAAPNTYESVIQMPYDRITLVAHTGGERVTIDRNLRFQNPFVEEGISQEVVVIETKSAFGRGIADSILRSAGQHPVGSCSKYCIGLAALGMVSRYNKFLPAFRRLVPHLV